MKPELFDKIRRPFQRTDAPVSGSLSEDEAAAKGRRRRIVLLSALAVGGVSVGIYALSHMGSAPPPAAAAAQTGQSVSVATITSHQFHPQISLTGEARPKRDIHVFAPASGVRVMQLLADEGDTVRAGQPLARLDVNLSNAQTQAAQASVAEAQSAAIRARDEYQRAESIRSSGALSDEAIEQRRAAASAADARLSAARAQLQEVNARLQGGYVRAPMAGKVISRSVQLGAMVDQQEMFRIAAGDELEVATQISESDVLGLQLGTNATFHLVDGTTETGTLTRSPASINSRTRTGEALFDLPRGTRVRPGMYLRGEAQLPAHDALAAPQAAILYDNGQSYVFVVDASNHAHKTPIRTGLRDGDMVEILAGIEPGARLVGAGAAFVQDGDAVNPIDAHPAPPQRQGENEDPLQLRGRSG